MTTRSAGALEILLVFERWVYVDGRLEALPPSRLRMLGSVNPLDLDGHAHRYFREVVLSSPGVVMATMRLGSDLELQALQNLGAIDQRPRSS